MWFIIAHVVICPYCKIKFDTDKEPFVKPNSQRYAHVLCHENFLAKQNEEDKSKENLIKYIRNLFGIQVIPPKVWKQLKTYTEQYHYTYVGILNALIYAFEVKHNDISKACGGIGIVPYCYLDAQKYFESIEQSNTRNEQKMRETDSGVQIIEVYIPVPVRKPARRRKFKFLEEE